MVRQANGVSTGPLGYYNLFWLDFGNIQVSDLITGFYPDIRFFLGGFFVKVRNERLFLTAVYNDTEQSKSTVQRFRWNNT